MEADPTSIADQRYGLLMQIKGIMAGFNGLEQFNRFAFRAQVHEKRLGTFLNWREEMYAALGVYNTMLQVIDLKNRRKRDARELESIIEYRMMQISTRNAKTWRGIATSNYADLNLNIDDLYERLEHAIINDYARIEEMFAMRGVEPDAAIVAGWYAYEAMEKAYTAAYMTLLTLMDDVNEAYGWKHFQISNLEYRRYLSDLHFETIRGEQNTSIDEKAILQLMIYAAYNGLELKTPIDKISGSNHYFNISDLFRVASNVQCIGWMKEYHKVQFGAEWEQIHRVFGEMMALTEGPLINKFRAEVEYSEPLQIIWDKVGQSDESKQRIADGHRGDAIFQTIDQDFWRSGELTGTVEAYFDFDFRYMPSPQYAVVSFFAGDPGCLSAGALIETSLGPKKIETLMGQKDLEVLSLEKDGSFEYRRAIPIANKRQMLYRLTTSSGVVLATLDHKFLRMNGQWQRLETLKVGDKIASFGKETCLETFPKEMRESRLSERDLSASSKQEAFLLSGMCEDHTCEADSEKEDQSDLSGTSACRQPFDTFPSNADHRFCSPNCCTAQRNREEPRTEKWRASQSAARKRHMSSLSYEEKERKYGASWKYLKPENGINWVKTHHEELSALWKAYYEKYPEKLPNNKLRRNRMTGLERIVSRVLDAMNLEWEWNKCVKVSGRFLFPDFRIKNSIFVIEANGDRWHQDSQRDEERLVLLRLAGLYPIVLTETDIRAGPARISQVLLSSPLKELARPTLLTYMYQEQTATSSVAD